MSNPSNESALSLAEVRRLAWTHPIHYLSCGLGSGLLPFMPGTWGSLMAIPFFYLMVHLHWWQYASCLVLAFGLGVWLCDFSEKAFRQKDHSSIVWDEMLGMWITLYHTPFHLNTLVVGFILFRIFDIFKPWPINYLQRVAPGGLGIMLDDAAAGVIAWALLQLWILFF